MTSWSRKAERKRDRRERKRSLHSRLLVEVLSKQVMVLSIHELGVQKGPIILYKHWYNIACPSSQYAPGMKYVYNYLGLPSTTSFFLLWQSLSTSYSLRLSTGRWRLQQAVLPFNHVQLQQSMHSLSTHKSTESLYPKPHGVGNGTSRNMHADTTSITDHTSTNKFCTLY